MVLHSSFNMCRLLGLKISIRSAGVYLGSNADHWKQVIALSAQKVHKQSY